MKFEDYCVANRGAETTIANTIGTTLSHISRIKRKKIKCSLRMAIAITIITKGQVPLKEFLTDKEIDDMGRALEFSWGSI